MLAKPEYMAMYSPDLGKDENEIMKFVEQG